MPAVCSVNISVDPYSIRVYMLYYTIKVNKEDYRDWKKRIVKWMVKIDSVSGIWILRKEGADSKLCQQMNTN